MPPGCMVEVHSLGKVVHSLAEEEVHSLDGEGGYNPAEEQVPNEEVVEDVVQSFAEAALLLLLAAASWLVAVCKQTHRKCSQRQPAQ